MKRTDALMVMGRKLSGLSTNLIERTWILTHKEVDTSSTVYLAGAPRSGTTWIMEIIEAIGNYRVVFEPFFNVFYPEVDRYISKIYDPIYRLYLPPESENPELEEYVLRVLNGKVAGFWYSRPRRILRNIRWITADKVLVKDVWTTRLLPWITRKFGNVTKNFILLLRHPCAVIESQMRTCIGNPLCYTSDHIVREYVLRHFHRLEWREELDARSISRVIREGTPKELLAVIWSMDYYIPLRLGGSFNLLFYEDLVFKPEDTMERLMRSLNLNFKKIKYLRRNSPTTKEPSKNIRDYALKWTERFTKEEIERILSVINLFSLTFYNEKPEPDHEGLSDWVV